MGEDPLAGLMFGNVQADMAMPDMMPMQADFGRMQNEFKKEKHKMEREEHKMERVMLKMEKSGIKSFSDTKETDKINGNLHEQETKCIDGKCHEKVMNGKTFDPQAEARKKAAIEAKKKDLEIAAAAKHKAEQAAAQAAAAQKAAQNAAIAEKRAEKEAAVSARRSLPDFPEDFGDSSFFAETSSSVMHKHILVFVGAFTVGSVATLVFHSFRRRTSASARPLLA